MAESIISTVLPNNSIRSFIPRDEKSTVYVTNTSNSAQREDIIPQNTGILAFNNTTFGSNSVFRISKAYQFLDKMFVKFNITLGADTIFTSNPVAYSFIDRIRYKVGSTEDLYIYGENLVDFLLEQCPNDPQKKQDLFDLAGDPNALKFTETYNLYAFLPLPWSTLHPNCLGDNAKPFPIHALNDNIEIEIFLRSASDVYSASAPNMKSAQLCWSFKKIGNFEQMIKSAIRFPFKMPIARFSQSVAATADRKEFYINGFRKGECNEIQFHLADNIATNKNYYSGVKIYDINVYFNGSIIWQGNNSDRMWAFLGSDSSQHYGKSRIALQLPYSITTAPNPDVKTNVISYALSIDQNEAQTGVIKNAADANSRIIQLDGYIGGTVANNVTTAPTVDLRQFNYVIPFGEVRYKMLKSPQNYNLSGDFSKQSLLISYKHQALTGTGTLFGSMIYTGIYQMDEFGSAILVF